jgi:hypothetical protein
VGALEGSDVGVWEGVIDGSIDGIVDDKVDPDRVNGCPKVPRNLLRVHSSQR